MGSARMTTAAEDQQVADRPENVGGDIEVARRVLEIEIDGLRALGDVLDGNFVRAVNVIAALAETGRVVVTGMGKSGHIGRKIAATLSSTGTPAQYVHPAEASHGDLGMITDADAVLALSNSGETPELSAIVAYAKRYHIPLIAITAQPGSSLDRAADVSLIIPHSAEACPMNLAPTTSTTVMMALGDAIAVALLERIGFSPEKFNILHPGGQLGRRFIKVSDVMHTGEAVPVLPLEAPMADALIEMTRKSFGCVGLVGQDGRLEGIITDGDLRRHMNEGLLGRTAKDVMTPEPTAIDPSILAAQALGLMNECKITSLFVVENGLPIGILHIHDCLRAGIS